MAADRYDPPLDINQTERIPLNEVIRNDARATEMHYCF